MDPSSLRSRVMTNAGANKMKRIIYLILIGACFAIGLPLAITRSLRNDDLLQEHVTAFYRSKGTVPSAKEELLAFEQQMNLPLIANSFRKIEVTQPSEGIIRIVSKSGLIFGSRGETEFLVGKNTIDPDGSTSGEK